METQLLDAVPAWNHGTQEGGADPGAAWEAVAKIQDAVQRIEADSEADTGQYTYRYLSFEALQTALRPHFEAADVMVVQSSQPCPYPGDIDVRTRFRHKSGGWVEFGLIMPRGVDGQKAGGIFTYAKRYALGAALNIAIGKDDDARAASPPPAAAQDVQAVGKRFKALTDEDLRKKATAAFDTHQWPPITRAGFQDWNADQLAEAQKLATRLEKIQAQRDHLAAEEEAPPQQAQMIDEANAHLEGSETRAQRLARESKEQADAHAERARREAEADALSQHANQGNGGR
ncbi:MAG: ERF family protein [Candidatus Microthrix sp.]|jgi:hypothetical protein|uniref:ERF family protein n=1 Tax=Candidatus Neomicrothrix subdominans TaxID=2954438 RepID=A0A936NAP8_9ACTN|nr:ERF family protein [Candidatus Microthrix sp.]MBK9296763.1 ERF family protein [Candidatus Microthrix subdominans]MBP7406120.1 ERF family protein [Candidatus Microthrix sp.]